MEQKTILLVEDDGALRDLLKTFLENCDYEIYTARNGRVGFEQYQNLGSQLDLIISDVVMPELDGVAFMEQVREHDWATPIILMSSIYRQVVRIKKHNILQVPKPFQLRTLEQWVAEALA